MAIHCSSCETEIDEAELPRLGESARVLCPECGEPLVLPEMTMPLSLAGLPFASSQGGVDPGKHFALLIVSGAEAGKVLDIKKPTVTIGRSDCDLLVDDPELSRRHAQVEITREGDAKLVDLDSTNGTYVDDERIKEVPIENRSKFRVGSHEIALVVTDRDD